MVKKDYNDQEVNQIWPKLKSKLPDFFDGLDIKPSLLHGDLWSGNTGQVGTDPTIFDAASFYGHHEYDLGIGIVKTIFKTNLFTLFVMEKSNVFNYWLFYSWNVWWIFSRILSKLSSRNSKRTWI